MNFPGVLGDESDNGTGSDLEGFDCQAQHLDVVL